MTEVITDEDAKLLMSLKINPVMWPFNYVNRSKSPLGPLGHLMICT